ncbi:MAG: hypothetical protein H7Y33_13665 [Cytophagales bacterium]|nr:hypothetical protein [Rhizobacter sp.]
MVEMLKRSWLVVLAGLVAVGVVAYALMRSPAEAEPTPASSATASGVAGAGARSAASGGSGAQPWEVTVSDAMGATLSAARLFELGFAGGLVIDRNTRASIEALLNSMPEELSEKDLARLERTLREGLPKEDAEKALKLVRDYRGYTKDVREELLPKGIPNSLVESMAFFDQMDAVRRRHFDDATANALFGPYDGYARITMEAMFVQQDATLTPEQKNQRLDVLRAKLPADQKPLIPVYVPEPAASAPGA